jgi:hypothetical protein
MIADADKHRHGAKPVELALNEVVPLRPVIRSFVRLRVFVFGLVQVVFVDEGRSAQVAQVPVERRGILLRPGGDGRHHYVAAIARISGDREGPGARIGRVILGESRHEKKKNGDQKNDLTGL